MKEQGEGKVDVEPVTLKIKVLDVIPYRHGVYCSIEDGKPFVNEIVGKDWSEDGERVILMLETHNFLFHSPDDEIDVVALEPRNRGRIQNEPDFLSKRPKPFKTCESCGGKGKIEVERQKKGQGGEGKQI